MRIHSKACSFIIALIIYSITSLNAQKVSLKDVQLNLSLQDYRLEDIIDGTPDEDQIGYVYSGLVNSTLKPVYLDDSVTDEFENLFKQAFSSSSKAIPLVIRINSLQVNEWAETFQKKVNLISLSLSIFQQVEDDKYVLIADRIINNYDLDGIKVKEIGQGIGIAVDRAFDYLDLYIDQNRPGLTWSQLWEYQAFQGLPYPRIDDDLKIFEHYSDFRQNKPLEGSSATIVKKRAGQVLKDDSGLHPTGIWGYTINGNLFINGGKKFLALERVDDGYATVLRSNGRKDFQEEVGLFGVSKILGILAFIGAQNNYEIPLASQTGYLDIKSIYDHEIRKDRAALGDKSVIEFAPFGHPDDKMDIKVDSQLVIQLSKGEFFQIPNGLKATELQACVSEKCITIALDSTPMHRVIFKKGRITHEPFTEKEKMRFLRNVDLRYWVLF